VADFDSQDKLKQEKELLGFYISDHPLKSVQQSARILAPINLGEMHEQPDNVTLSAIVIWPALSPWSPKRAIAWRLWC
jgi:DNA polymerase-3 subunit alpha